MDYFAGILKDNPLIGTAVVIVLSLLLGWVASMIAIIFLKKLDHYIQPEKTNILIDARRWRAPLICIFPALLLLLMQPLMGLQPDFQAIFMHSINLWLIAAIAFLCIRITAMVRELILSRFDVDTKDNLHARAAHTQFQVIERILVFGIVLIAIACMLMTFEKVRQVGMSLLASAGVVGVVLGFAAQRSISTVFAGIQVALTQPIRVDDVVIVENEWGRIEEITLTYVVVKIWDLRRLILPITYFIEKPFQNWTRTSADILGTVFVYTDYAMDVDLIRSKLKDIVDGNPLWDGDVCSVQVTDAKEQTLELRALISTEDASKGWDLRCQIREELIAFIRNDYPQFLPRTRVEFKPESETAVAAE